MPPTADLTPDTSLMLQAALQWARRGWYVFPLRPGTKVPALPSATGHPRGCRGECGRDGHGAWDGTQDEDTIRRWWATIPGAGIGGETIGRVVVDLDVQHGADPDALPLPPTRTHMSGRGNGNRHLVYLAPGGLAAGLRSGANVLGPGVDIRAGGGSYVVLPPTPHTETGQPYQVLDEDVPEAVLEDGQVRAVWEAAGVVLTPGRATGKLRLAASGGRTVPAPARGAVGSAPLDVLLAQPPAEGGRNDWLTRVCGHLVKMARGNLDLYSAMVASANRGLDSPLPALEMNRTADSVWRAEQEHHEQEGMSSDTGWLRGDGQRLYCQVRENVGGTLSVSEAEWGNFDVQALARAENEDGTLGMQLVLHLRDRDKTIMVRESMFGDDMATRRWLASMDASVTVPPGAFPQVPAGTRLQRYLSSQNPPMLRMVDSMGWDDVSGVFVTADGTVTAGGLTPQAQSPVVLRQDLQERGLRHYSYGFEGDLGEARRVLREVLTFQEPEVTSVFGAWWAACFLRPQVQREVSLFPLFGLEATAESGKTTGFFASMVQLNGNLRGNTAPTRAALRDAMSANQSGIVWVDDMDDLEDYGEILRASTTQGVLSKMASDNSSVTSTRVVAPVLVTGESLGLGAQKALADRSIVLNVRSPKDRRSLHGDHPQWDDVMSLQGQYPDSRGGLSVLSGWLLQLALGAQSEMVACLHEMRRDSHGRFGDQMAVIRAGARLLDALVGESDPWSGGGAHSRVVDSWVAGRVKGHLDGDNSLTLRLVPWALRQWGFPSAPEVGDRMGRFAGIDTPVFVSGEGDQVRLDGSDSVRVWVSSSLLADAWSRERGGRVEDRTETAVALAQQARAVGAVSELVAVQGGRRSLRYWVLPAEYGRVVLERARS